MSDDDDDNDLCICETCNVYFVPCKLHSLNHMWCEQGIDNMWRLHCIFCMLYEEHDPDEQWDSASEFFDEICFSLVELGRKHGANGNVQLNDFHVHGWYAGIEKLYEIGFQYGQLQRKHHTTQLNFKKYCTLLLMDHHLPLDLITLINLYINLSAFN